MPASWHRLNSNGTLVKLKGLYRLNSDGTLARIKAAYRLNSDGTLVKVFAGLAEPSVKVASPPYLYMVDPSGFADPEISAYTSYKMYLTRGKWNEDPLEFIMKIQRSTSPTFASVTDLVSLTKTYTTYNDSDFEFEIPTNTANRPVITNALIRAGNYYRGSIKATNSDNLFDTYLTPVVKPKIDAQLSITLNLAGTIGSSPTANGGTFSWTYAGYESIVAADVYSQTISFYPQGNTSGTPIYSQSVSPGTSTTAAPNSTVVISNVALEQDTTYTVIVSAVMNDLWKTENSELQTIAQDDGDFTTAADKPSTPTITSATDVGTNRPYNNGAVSLAWTQPSGGATATGYKIEYSIGPDHIAYIVLNSNTGSTSTSGTFTGLDANKNYKFYVTALGTSQNSDRSDASSSVLITTVPDVPRLVGAFAGNAQATVFWELPTADGGKSILDYRATSNPGGITGTVNALEVIVTGLTNYTAYTFTVAARNANGYSAESSASNSVTPQLPLPVGSGTVTITYDSESSYVYKITGYGTWSNSTTKYDYEWQTSPNNSTWTTRSSGTDVSTIPNYNAAAYKGNFIRLRVYGRNQTGPAVTPLVSATTTIFYTTPIINSFTVTGGNSSVSYSYSYSADDPTVAVEIGYKLSSTTTYTTISSPASSGTINLTSGTYDFRLFVTNSAAGAFRTGAAYVTGVTVVSPTISGISVFNATATPGAATSIVVGNSGTTNQGSVSWNNGSNTSASNLRLVTGAGTLVQQADPSSVATSGTFAINSTGTANVTIRAINTSKRVEVTWAQTNAQSYRILYTVAGVPGTQTLNGDSSAANPSVLLGTSANTFTITNITVYPQTSQGGTGVTLSAPAGTSATGADAVRDTTGSGSVTYTPLPGLTPIISAATSTATGFTGQVTNYSASYTWNIVTSSGSVSWGTPNANEATYNFTVTGLAPGSSATVTITTTRAGYNDGSATRSGTALLGAALIPTFGTKTSTSDGFTGSVTNYDAAYTWTISATPGSVVWGTASGSTRPFTVTGVNPGTSSTVVVSTSRTGYNNGSAQTSQSSTTGAALTPTFETNVSTATGFTGAVTNYDANFGWGFSVVPGTATFTWGTASGSRRPFTVTGMAPGSSATVELITSRTGYFNGSAQTTGTSTTGAALTPTFGTNSSTAGGFFGSVTNYDAAYTWGIAASNGSVSWSLPSGSTRAFTVSGLAAGQPSTVTVSTSRTGYFNGSAQTTGSATNPTYNITFNTSGYVTGSTNTFISNTAPNTIRTGTVGQLATAPADPTPPSGYTFAGYWRDGSPQNYLNQVNSGGSWTITATDKTFNAYYNAIIPNVTQITALGLGNTTAPYIRFTITSTNAASLSIMLYRSSTSSTGPWTALSTPSVQSTSGTLVADFSSRTGTTSNWYYVEVTPYFGATATGTAGTTRTSRVKRGTETTTTTVYP